MNALILLLADSIPEEVLIGKLKSDLSEYEICPTDAVKKQLHMSCLVLVTKYTAESHPQGVDGFVNDFKESEQANVLFKNIKVN